MIPNISGHAKVYASAGKDLIQYGLDIDNCALVREGAVTLPANVQYASRMPQIVISMW